MNVTLIAIDLAKSTFQVCGVNRQGKEVFNHATSRKKLTALIAQHPGIPIAMEACSGSNYWGRTFQQNGHEVLLIPPPHVKPFVKGNKNDRNDAFAISEAARRPKMRVVAPRSLEQTDMILLHRIRERRVRARTALLNQMRGLLSEYGIVLPAGIATLRNALPLLLEDAENGLTIAARRYLQDLLDEWRDLDEHIHESERAIRTLASESPTACRLMDIRGVGVMIATAALAKLGRGDQFKNGRQFSACLGLVPRELSSGGVQKLGGISKRGDDYLRRMLIQGAWSVINYAEGREDGLSQWALQVKERRGKHKAVIAVANKLARIIWALVRHETTYCPA
jgi:transposase